MALTVEDGVLTSASGIYAVVNRVTQKCYVGSAVNMRDRQQKHLSELRRGIHHSPRLQRSWDKHGSGAFEFIVVELCEVPRLLEREQVHIDSMRAYDDGYNCLKTAGSRLGVRHSEDTKRKVGDSKRGKKRGEFSPQWRANLSAALKGKQNSLGVIHSEETRAKMRARGFTQAHRDAIGIAGLKYRAGYDAPPETKAEQAARVSKMFKGVPKPPEQRAKMAESARVAWERRRAA